MRAGTRLIIVTGLLALAACSAGNGVTAVQRDTANGAAPPPGGADPLRWGPCDDPAATDEALECATLTVPLDHDDPDGDTIDLALVRVPAGGDRQGAVLMNPGGPGGSGFDLVAYSGGTFQSELGLDEFDVVGFDPRGVDRSNGIRCVDDEFVDAHLYLDDTPDTAEEERLLEEDDRGFVEGCNERYGDTLRFYSTEATAKDMDLIRAAMGDDTISYLGISYGTYLGAVYATLFPERVRAMALDSAYEPNGDTVEEQYLTQIVGFEGAFDDWVAWCEGTDECAFRTADVGGRWDALRLRLDEAPLTAPDGRRINQSTMDTATQASLYSESDWPVLGDALAAAESGDGSGVLSLADAYNGRNADGSFDTLFQSLAIIECASGIEQQAPDDPEALLAEIQRQAPRFGADITVEDLTGDGGCDELMPPQPTAEVDFAGDAPIVVIGGLNDPATPFRWAEEMTAAMGPNARLVTFTGEGHGQLLVSSCVTEIEAAVLAEAELPDEGTTCDPDPVVERPEWWDDLPVPPGHTLDDIAAVKAVLGLSDTLGYGQTWVTEQPLEQADEAWADAMVDAGYQDLGAQDLGLTDVLERGYLSPDGDLVVIITLGPAAFDSDELVAAEGAVPDDTTVVLVAYLPQ